MEKIKTYQLALKTYELIKDYAEAGEDYSLLQRSYNDFVECDKLDLPYIRWIDVNTFGFYSNEKR